RGYLPAETEPDKFHGVGKFDAATGAVKKDPSAPASYTSVFGNALIELAQEMPSITAITAAMPSGTGLKDFGERFPKRFFDVGIAEEHAVTLAAGMAAAGLHPVAAIYSTFAQRAYDQLMHDVCLQNLPVTLCLDRGGLVGEDGPTHHGVFDLSYLRTMPGMTVFVPKDENELRDMLYTAVHMDSPTAIRYPRGAGLGVPLSEGFREIEIGKAEALSEGDDVALLAVGTMVDAAKKAAAMLEEKGVHAAVVNMRFVKPIDTATIDATATKNKLLVTLEENVLPGGFGSAVAEYMADAGHRTPLLRIGIPDRFVSQGAKSKLLESCGLLPEQIAENIMTAWTGLA
ncbi:MAG: 1-deoxy-D-xylulose-5-phosphate synthase, partial [Schwartzia sp.]|nr:1-deoxy-D-xylulose-5-phosphate synthase [Schwartzia sp. (in: firmicutes)]